MVIIDALDILCVQLTRDLFAIAKFLLHTITPLTFDAPISGVYVVILPSRVVWRN